MLRLCGAELVEVPALPYSQSEQLPARRPPPRRRAEEDREERRHLRRPVEQPRQPQGALRLDRPGNLGRDRRQDRRLHLLGRHRRHARRRLALSDAKRTRTSSSASPIRAARRCINLFTDGEAKATEGGSITEGIGLGRVTPIIEEMKVDKAYLIPDEEAVPIIFDLLRARRPLPRRLVRHQHRRRHPAGEGSRARPHHRDGARRLRHALSVEAVQSGLPALEKPAGAGLAGAQVGHQTAVREDLSSQCRPTACSATTAI